jgi:multiple sugar transport system substrate-binding protein
MLFGYCNYARAGFRDRVARFGSIARLGDDHRGAILGGAGLAVSATAADAAAAAAFASWVAGAECQRGLYFESGGQPAHRVAWDDEASDRQASGFFSATREAMELAWLRPRYAGFVDLQERLGSAVWAFLHDRGGVTETAAAIARL